ncbi:MAG: peptidase E [Capsulimonas sp.]|uniref:Type 1 glutamine amidotransferase-like domain-containing protein n=1 Tax=Capsulimonas sp. TaxID=2494211 RepID=UPI003265104C
MNTRTILALGDAAPSDNAINEYIVGLADKSRPTICFLGTATGDADGYIQKFHNGFSRFDCVTTHLSLFKLPSADLRPYLLGSDIIYVGGGNTRSMLALWREWGLDSILRDAWEQDIVLCGPSAGAICWFEQGTTDVVPGELNPISCLGFLPGSFCPHYDSEPLRRPGYRQMIADGTLKDGYAADDLVGLLFRGQELTEIVSARPDAQAYRVRQQNGQAVETPLTPTLYLK